MNNTNIKQSLVSIIMAAYNAEKTIASSIESVISQSYKDWELIIINDCSNDRTIDIISRYAEQDNRIRIVNNTCNMGASRTRKAGLEQAKGEWIAILDSDDLWEQDKLRRQLYVAKKMDAKLVFTGSAFIDDNNEILNWQLHVPKTISYREILKQNLVSNSSVLVKKDLYEKYYVVGDNNMHEDFAIWLQILRTGVIAYGIDKPLLIYRVSRKSKSGNKIKAARMNWNAYRYVGLNVIEAIYYMIWYTIKGVLKYRHIY